MNSSALLENVCTSKERDPVLINLVYQDDLIQFFSKKKTSFHITLTIYHERSILSILYRKFSKKLKLGINTGSLALINMANIFPKSLFPKYFLKCLFPTYFPKYSPDKVIFCSIKFARKRQYSLIINPIQNAGGGGEGGGFGGPTKL